MHIPWTKRKPLTELLSNKQETVRIFFGNDRETAVATIRDYRIQQGCHVLAKYVHECLAKEGSTAETKLDINSMYRDQLEQELYCKHSRNLSAGNQRTVSDCFKKASANIGQYHNWSVRFYAGTRAEDTG